MYRNYSIRTVYETNFSTKSPMHIASWTKPSVTLALAPELQSQLPVLLQKTLSTFLRGRFLRPLALVRQPKSRSSRSASASASTSAAPHRVTSPHWVEDEPDSDAAFVLGYSSDKESESGSSLASGGEESEDYGTVSSSEADVSRVLERDARRTVESNKDFLRDGSGSDRGSSKRCCCRCTGECDETGPNRADDPANYYYPYQQFYYSPPQSQGHTKFSDAVPLKCRKAFALEAKKGRKPATGSPLLQNVKLQPPVEKEAAKTKSGKSSSKKRANRKAKKSPAAKSETEKKTRPPGPKTCRRREYEEDRCAEKGQGRQRTRKGTIACDSTEEGSLD